MSARGRRRTVTDEQVEKVRAFKAKQGKPLWKLAMELGISEDIAKQIRRGYVFRRPSP